MNNKTLDQKRCIDSNKIINTTIKLQRKNQISNHKESIYEKLKNFAFSIPDFRRVDGGNIRHKLGDMIMLMILARMSKCIGRADIIEFGRHNLKKFQSMGLLGNGVPSESTLCRVDNGIEDLGFAEQMAVLSKEFQNELVNRKSGQKTLVYRKYALGT